MIGIAEMTWTEALGFFIFSGIAAYFAITSERAFHGILTYAVILGVNHLVAIRKAVTKEV